MTGWDMEKRGEEKRWEKRKRKKEEKRWEERGKREREKDEKERKRKEGGGRGMRKKGWQYGEGEERSGERREERSMVRSRTAWFGVSRPRRSHRLAQLRPSSSPLLILQIPFLSRAEFSRSLFLKSHNACYLKIFEWHLCQGHDTLYCSLYKFIYVSISLWNGPFRVN